MFVTIFNRQYQIEISAKPLVHDGKPARALLQRAPKRRILIDPSVPGPERYREVLHEARHAWTGEQGIAVDEEADARDFAVCADLLDEQLEAQGGRAALAALKAPERGPADQAPAVALNTRHPCKVCGTDTMGGSVRNGAPRFVPTYAVYAMDREFECEACGARNRWTEICTESGEPKGSPLPGVEYQAV